MYTCWQVIADYQSKSGLESLLTSVAPAAEFTDLALFVDSSNESLNRFAQVKGFWIG